jgi:hypothetical protein
MALRCGYRDPLTPIFLIYSCSGRQSAKIGAVTAGAPPEAPSPWQKFVRYMAAPGAGPSKESRAWRVFRAIRWTAALVVVVLVVRASQINVCSTTNATRTGLGIFSGLPKTASSRVCTPPGLSDLVGYFAIIAVLLLPDAKSIGIGGLQFERLTSQVASVGQDVRELRQTVTTTITIGASLIDEMRTHFKTQKMSLDNLRGFLPSEARTAERLHTIDEFARGLDSAPLGSIIKEIGVMEDLIDEVKQATARELARQGAASDTEEEVAGAQEAQEVVREILNP